MCLLGLAVWHVASASVATDFAECLLELETVTHLFSRSVHQMTKRFVLSIDQVSWLAAALLKATSAA